MVAIFTSLMVYPLKVHYDIWTTESMLEGSHWSVTQNLQQTSVNYKTIALHSHTVRVMALPIS